MGKLRIVDKGIRVEGEAEFYDNLYATRIHSRTVSNTVYFADDR